MINHYLSSMYEQELRAGQDREHVEALKRLPNDVLYKLASGTLKLAHYGDGDVEDWLQKYKGTPLFSKAVAIEKQKLELDAAEQAQRQEREEVMRELRDDNISDERDRLCLEKRVLDLELATSQAGGAGQADALEAQEGAGLELAQQAHETEMAQQGKPPIPATPEQQEAGPPGPPKPKAEEKPEGEEKGPSVTVKTSMAEKISSVEKVARMLAQQDAKTAAALTQAGRDDLKKKEFALPGERKYPIHDERHASTALAYAKGKPEQSTVYAAVAKKYPGLAARSSVPAVREDAKEKKAFAVTERGHNFDAARYRMLAQHEAEKAEQQQGEGALGYRDPSGELKPGNVLDVLRFSSGSPDPREKARHYEYAAKKHEQGSNAWNPFGGAMTPSSHEEGGSRFFFGKTSPKTAGIGDAFAKGVQALKPFGSAVATGARDVAGAARAGGIGAGLREAKNVGGIIAQAHPLATAGAAGAAGLGAGMALNHRQQR